MPFSDANPETIWERLLSGNPEQVWAAYAGLDTATQQSVYRHLEQMAGGADWHPGQQAAAQAALRAIQRYSPGPAGSPPQNET